MNRGCQSVLERAGLAGCVSVRLIRHVAGRGGQLVVADVAGVAMAELALYVESPAAHRAVRGQRVVHLPRSREKKKLNETNKYIYR